MEIAQYLSLYSSIIIHPYSVDNINILASLITDPSFTGKNVFLMTFNPSELKHILNYELPNSLFIPYAWSAELELAINNDVIVLIDSLSFFIQQGLHNYFINPRCKLILLTTLGVNDNEIITIRSIIPDIKFLNTNYIKDITNLDFILEITSILNTEEYMKRLELQKIQLINGTSIEKREAELKIKTLQIGNFIYPKDRQRLLNLPREKRPPIPNEKEWITMEIIENLEQYSPKIHKLLTRLIASLPQQQGKHIIYTRFKENYGAYLLQAILTKLGINSLILSGEYNTKEKIRIITEFNDNKDLQVLITTIIPTEGIFNTNTIYFLEGYNYGTFINLLDKTYKRKYYSLPITKLEIITYIAQLSDGIDASDANYYRTTSSQITQMNQTYDRLIEVSTDILYEINKGLVI